MANKMTPPHFTLVTQIFIFNIKNLYIDIYYITASVA